MKFLLNDDVIDENTLPSDFTALRYLREKRGLTGTKEGCASGDCGACTLLVGALVDGEVEYSTFNSCITPIQSLAGKHLVSVEYLSQSNSKLQSQSSDNDKLHPAQQAMVEHHGSQCGFCTPGIVLSLAGLYENNQSSNTEINREAVCDAISGNLCRCTGYRPIIDAGLAMQTIAMQKKADQAPEAWSNLADNADKVKAQLAIFQDDIHGSSNYLQSNYLQPTNLDDLLAVKKSNPDATLIAGGTDLMLENTQRFHDFDTLIDVSQVSELKQIQNDGTTLILGASVTYSELEDFSKTAYPHIYNLLSRIASRQIRNRGTLGGNVANASPIADMPPLLLALDADMKLIKVDGSSREVNINDFYQGYKTTLLIKEKGKEELIESFSIDLAKLVDFHRFYKISKRMEDDISSVMLAVRFAIDHDQITEVRLAFGGMAATPIRAFKAEQALLNKSMNDEAALAQTIENLRSELTPLSDMRASARYRLDMACNLVKKAWLELNGAQVPTFSGHPVSDASLSYERLPNDVISSIKEGGASHA